MTTHLLRHLLKNKQELGLADEQVTKLQALALDADRARIRAEADVMVSERELRSLMWDEKAQLNAIEAKVKEKSTLDATVRIIGIKARRELMGVLTPEQQAKEKALWQRYRHRDGGHMMKAEVGESLTGAGGADFSSDAPEQESGKIEGTPSAG